MKPSIVIPMKKSTLRIVVPVVAALTVTCSVLGVVWWQISQSQDQLRAQLRVPGTSNSSTQTDNVFHETEPADTGDRVLLHLRQGDLLAAQGNWAQAEDEYRKSVENGGGVPALRKLAQAQLQRRNIEGAKQTIERLKSAGVRQEDLLLLEVIVALRTGELEQAKTWLGEAPESPQKHYGLALVAIIQTEHETAKAELQTVIAGWDPTLRAYARTLEEAYEEFGLFPDSRPIHLTTLLARALAQTQECELALPLLSQVLQEEPEYRDAWMVQGYCELTTERPQQAFASFMNAYEIDPEKPEIQYFLGRAALELKDWKQSAQFFSYALENGFTPEKEVRRYLARAAAELGDSDLAIRQLQALMELPDADVEVASQLVTLLIGLERNEEALTAAQKAVSRWNQEARAHDLLGWSLIELDRTQEARQALDEALRLDPLLQSAREHYGQL